MDTNDFPKPEEPVTRTFIIVLIWYANKANARANPRGHKVEWRLSLIHNSHMQTQSMFKPSKVKTFMCGGMRRQLMKLAKSSVKSIKDGIWTRCITGIAH